MPWADHCFALLDDFLVVGLNAFLCLPVPKTGVFSWSLSCDAFVTCHDFPEFFFFF